MSSPYTYSAQSGIHFCPFLTIRTAFCVLRTTHLQAVSYKAKTILLDSGRDGAILRLLGLTMPTPPGEWLPPGHGPFFNVHS